MISRIGILASLLVADVLTTSTILSQGGIEYNPLMAGVVPDLVGHLVLKVLVLLVLILVLEVGMRGYDRTRDRGYCAIWSLYGGIVVNNLIWMALLSR